MLVSQSGPLPAWDPLSLDNPPRFSWQFVYEGMEESGSEGLDEMLHARKDDFLKVNISYFYPLLSYYVHTCIRHKGGNEIIFTLARLASESNLTLASEDLPSPGGENMKKPL